MYLRITLMVFTFLEWRQWPMSQISATSLKYGIEYKQVFGSSLSKNALSQIFSITSDYPISILPKVSPPGSIAKLIYLTVSSSISSIDISPFYNCSMVLQIIKLKLKSVQIFFYLLRNPSRLIENKFSYKKFTLFSFHLLQSIVGPKCISYLYIYDFLINLAVISLSSIGTLSR